MSLASTLAQGRAAAEARMGATNGASTGTLRRWTGNTTTNAEGYEVPEWATIHADLTARIGGQWGAGVSKQSGVGDVNEQVSNRIGSFPAGTDLADDDYYEITAGDLAGKVYRVVEADAADQQTASRVPVEAVRRPEEWV